MHIALYSPSWPMFRYPNGIVTYVHHLRAELLRQGHRVSIFSARVAPDNVDPDVHLVSPTRGFRLQQRVSGWVAGRTLGTFGWGRLIAAKIAEVHRTAAIDVVEMEESFGWCADVQRLLPIPLVVKLHGPAFLSLVEEELDTPAAQRKIADEGEAMRRLPVITSPSRDTLERTLKRYGLAPSIGAVVPNPMSIETGFELWNAQRCDAKTVLFVGRFDKRKGGDTVLLAFRLLLGRDPQARLVFVGPDPGLTASGGSRVHFEDFCGAHFSAAERERIDYRGPLSRDQIVGLRTRSAVTLIASRWDNQPNTALEAMIQACPVVALDSGGVDELIEHGVSGLLAPPNDLDGVCEQLSVVLKDLPAAGRMGLAAREVVLQRHALATLTTQTLAIYRQAIARHPGARDAATAHAVG